jgi:putative membrane protein insertion efficiency factor
VQAGALLKWLLIKLVRGYQLLLSPVLGSSCRYYPTCSSYMIQAIEIHGVLKGSWMGLRRISRCHPWHEGGIDPVPGSPEASACCEHHADDMQQDETPETEKGSK